MEQLNNINWFEKQSEEVLQELNTDIGGGLSTKEAGKRQEEHGKNKLTAAKNESKFKKFLRQFNDMLIYVLLVAAVITTLLGQMIDTIVILMVVIINALIGYFQENKAEKAL